MAPQQSPSHDPGRAPPLAEAADSNILSRVAERVYWLGRYIERTDATARLIAVNGNLLMDLPARLPLGWWPLVNIIGSEELFQELYGAHAEASERNVCRFMSTDTRNPGCIVNSLARARENMRNIRETMPEVAFEYVNDLCLYARNALQGATSRSRRSKALDGISRRAQQLEGFFSQNMLHDASWELLRLGNHIERADMTTRIIDVRSADLFVTRSDLEPFEHIQWRSILRSAYAMQAYMSSVREPVAAPLVLQFLFKDERLPRSYLRCLHAVRRSLLSLPRHEEALRHCNRAIDMLNATNVSDLGAAHKADDLHQFIDACQVRLGEMHDAIAATYFDFPVATSSAKS